MSRGPAWRGPMFSPATAFFGLIIAVSLLIYVTTHYHGHEKPEIETILTVIAIGDLLFFRRRRR